MKKLAIVCSVLLAVFFSGLTRAEASSKAIKKLRAIVAEEKSRVESGFYNGSEKEAQENYQIINLMTQSLIARKAFFYKKEVLKLQRYSSLNDVDDYCNLTDDMWWLEDILDSYLSEYLPECVSYFKDLLLESIFYCPDKCWCNPDPIFCLTAQYERILTIIDIMEYCQ